MTLTPRPLTLALALLGLHSAPFIAAAGQAPVGPGGAAVTLPGSNYTLRMSESFTALDLNKWHRRVSTPVAFQRARCVAEAKLDRAEAVSVDAANQHLVVTGSVVSSADGTAVTGAGGVHKEHLGGGIISNANLGYGYYEVWVKPYLAPSHGLHTAFWTRASETSSDSFVTPAGQNAIEIDALEIDSGDGTTRTSNTDPSKPRLATKNLFVLYTHPALDLTPFGDPVPSPARGNREFRTDVHGWIKAGFDYSPSGVRYFENGVQVSHTQFPPHMPQIAARHPVYLSAKATGFLTPGSTPIESRFKEFRFFAADHMDVNLLSNGGFDDAWAFTRPKVVAPTTDYRFVNGAVVYSPATNACETVTTTPAATTTVGSNYPVQWLVAPASSDPAASTKHYFQPRSAPAPTAAAPLNRELVIQGYFDPLNPPAVLDLPNVKVYQEHKHINPGYHHFRGRVMRPAGFTEAALRLTYSTGPGTTATTVVPLPYYGANEAPVYKEIPVTSVLVGDDGENTRLTVELVAVALEALGTRLPGDTVARNSHNQELKVQLDDLQLYRRSSATAPPPPRTSSTPGHDFSQKIVFRNYTTPGLGPHHYPDSTADAAMANDWQTKTVSQHLLPRGIGGIDTGAPETSAKVDLTVSVDVYSARWQDAMPVLQMDGLASSAGRGWGIGLRADGTPFCALGNLSTLAPMKVVNMSAGAVTPYASTGLKTGSKLTCTYQRVLDALGNATHTDVTAYLNGQQIGATNRFQGYFTTQAPPRAGSAPANPAESPVGYYGHTAKLFFTNALGVKVGGVTQANFEGWLGNLTVWHRALSAGEVALLGGAPGF